MTVEFEPRPGRIEALLGARVAARISPFVALVRRAEQRARAIVWNRFAKDGRRSARGMRSLKNSHLGEMCVIIGNGPSLNVTEMDRLKGTYTIGLNRVYLMRDRLGFDPSLVVVVNRLVVEQCREDFLKIESPLITTSANYVLLRQSKRALFLPSLAGRTRFSKNPLFGIYEGQTVTYVAMQIAYYMGFSKVVLVGVDHRFVTTGPAHQVVTSTGDDPNHFDPRYFGEGFRWQLPDLEGSEYSYGLARRVFERSGREFVDATVGGALEVFPKQTLKDALEQ